MPVNHCERVGRLKASRLPERARISRWAAKGKVPQGLLKVALSDSVGWRRRQKEATIWQTLEMAPMKIIAKQLRIHTRVCDELVASAISSTHLPYR